MSISFVAAGSLNTGTTSLSADHPAGVAAGDLELLQVISGHPSGLAPNTPAGWDKIADFSGGDPAAYGSGAGPRRLQIFARVYAAGDANPIVALAAGTNIFLGARMFAWHRTAGNGWRYVATAEDDTSSGTGVSVVMPNALTFLAGDSLIQFLTFPASGTSASSEGVTATNVTFGTTNERADDAVAVGAGGRLIASGVAVSSTVGTPQSSAPTITATASGATFAVGAAVRLREAQATITATPQSSSPPRVLVTVAGMTVEDIVSITLERSTGDELTEIRAAVDQDVTGDDAFVRTDGEQPFGVPVTYLARLTDVSGDVWTIESNAVQTDVDHEVLSDAILGLGVDCQIVSWAELTYTRESSVFNVNGRLVVVSGPNPGAQSELVLFTRTTADMDAMADLLDRATNGIVQLRTQARSTCDVDQVDEDASVDGYLAVLQHTLVRAGQFRRPQRKWRLSVAEVDAWVPELEAQGWTYADFDAHYTNQTYEAIDTEFSSQAYLVLDTFDWGI